MRNIINRLRFRQEPLVYIGILLAVGVVAVQVSGGAALPAVLSSNAGEFLVGTLAVLLGRSNVTAPATLDIPDDVHGFVDGLFDGEDDDTADPNEDEEA